MSHSFVVTGGGRGIGRAIVERLVAHADDVVVLVELEPAAVTWTENHPAGDRLRSVLGDAADAATADAAVEAAAGASLKGWVNNAAIFRDVEFHSAPVNDVIALIGRNLNPAIVGSAAAIRRFLASGSGGAIVNISSHQATRAVAGALTYSTAKAGVEGLTRALAVDYGPYGIRSNAVALGSITTARMQRHLDHSGAEDADAVREQLRRLHPLGRPGTVEEVAAAVVYLLSDEASFINGAVIPVDGGRSVLGLDPEARQG